MPCEYAKAPVDRVDDYWTDHKGSVTLNEHDKLVEQLIIRVDEILYFIGKSIFTYLMFYVIFQ